MAKGNKFESKPIYGVAKKTGADYRRKYGVSNNGSTWSSITFRMPVTVKKGKNAGKTKVKETKKFESSSYWDPDKVREWKKD